MATSRARLKLAYYFICKEILSAGKYATVSNYIVPIAVGFTLNMIEYGVPFQSLAPYIVPLLVQSLTRGIAAYSNRFTIQLAKLPRLQKDPYFLINSAGDIVCTEAGKNEMIKGLGIGHINELNPNVPDLLDKIKANDGHNFEIHVPKVDSFFEVFSIQKSPDFYNIWLHDITRLKKKDEGLKRVLKFNSYVNNYSCASQNASNILSHLADELISLGYQGTFILREKNNGLYSGHCYKKGDDGELVRSAEISLPLDEHLPIFASRKQNDFVRANIDDYDSAKAFYQEFKFHAKVTDFLASSIFNLIDFHSEKVSIMAFNKGTPITEDDELLLEPLVASAQSLINMLDRNKENESLFYASISGLCAASEYSDEITGQHVWRVNVYSEFLAGKMGLSEKAVSAIGKVAALHDIGKVSMPELIKFPGKYTEQQRNEMQRHTIVGADIIAKMQEQLSEDNYALQIAKEITLNHHQHWDGSGYPGLKTSTGSTIEHNFCSSCHEYEDLVPLKGDEIPVHALIVSLADTYDALRNARQYKPAFSHEKTVKIMAEDDRTGITGANRWGEKLWSTFLEHQRQLDQIYSKMS